MSKRQLVGFALILIGVIMTAAGVDVSLPRFGSLYLNILCIIIGVRFAFVGYRRQ